jgi:uncharacterized protein YxeA
MDFEAAGKKRKMQLSELEEWQEKAYHNAKLHKEKDKKMAWQKIEKEEIQTRWQGVAFRF